MILHATGSLGSFAAFLIAGFGLPTYFRRSRTFRWVTWPALALVVGSIVTGVLRSGTAPGLGQRLGFLCFFLWVGLIGFALLRSSSRRNPTGTFLLTAVSLLSIPPETRAQTERPIEARWSCYTEYGQSTIYTTPLWEATAFLNEVNNDFAQFLLNEYGYRGRVFCGGALLPSSTMAKLNEDNARARAQWRGEGKTVIETSYTYDPATASLAFACVGFTRVRAGTAYADSIFLSPVLRIPGNSQYGLDLAWTEYLQGSHGGSPMYPGGCTMLPPDPADHQAQIDRMPSVYNAQAPAILHVDWTYAGRSSGASHQAGCAVERRPHP